MTEQAERTALQARRAGDRERLFWSERGEIACAQHAPYPGTETWTWERWSPMTETERQAWMQLLKRAPECEGCHS